MKGVRAAVYVLALSFLVATAILPQIAVADSTPPDPRVEALLARMTLDEKIGQLTLLSAGDEFDPDLVRQGRVGAVMNFGMPDEIAAIRKLERESRLKIPLLIALDVVHGYQTLFPIPLAEAATFNPALAYLGAKWSAREAVSAGVDWTFGPMADVSRDVRWGRIVEGAGEDPFLASVFTAARVRGFRAGGLATTAKHFIGYGAAVGGRDYDAAYIPPAELRDIYLPPFRAAVEAGAEAMMIAYTDLDGLPVAGNPAILKDLLRGELGFEGFVLSDYNGAGELMNHGVAGNPAEAVRKAFLSGVDMEMVGGLYRKYLPGEVAAGRVPIEAIDDAVRRVLTVKFERGLFDGRKPQATNVGPIEPLPEAKRLARQMAAESLVLLQNRGGVLPITEATAKIAVIGPLAMSPRDLNGPHEARAVMEDTVTLFDGISQRARQNGASVSYTIGCEDLYCDGASGLGQAVEAAREADVVVAIMGEPRDMTGEGGSRAHLTLPGRQYEFVEALAATGTPVVLVLLGGRPLEIGRLLDEAPAILMAWYPGTEGGLALADVLFGDVSPSGKLPHTWPRTVGQVPIHYDRLPTGRPTEAGNRFSLKYVDAEISPQFPFGFGLSYTEFAFSDLEIVTPNLKASDDLEVRVSVANTGDRLGQEVVQLYVRDPVASRSRPLRQLKGFQKISLAPGESRVASFRIPASNLGFHLPDGTYVVEPGTFQVWVGGDSNANLQGQFEVTEG
ncbi:MAG: glycoside hydrolase family 3 C-terminal domain-containing protein, partial [Rhizobiales bacterium]|nr:glycoside hydrolase family 3 C-terminal domain-containing protein [Hyphomicrobiales bacterium]